MPLFVVSLFDGAADKLLEIEPGDFNVDGVLALAGDLGGVANLERLVLSGVEGESDIFLVRWRDLGSVSEWFKLSVDAAGVGPWPLVLPYVLPTEFHCMEDSDKKGKHNY